MSWQVLECLLLISCLHGIIYIGYLLLGVLFDGITLCPCAGELYDRMLKAGVKGRTITLKVKRKKTGAPEPIKFLVSICIPIAAIRIKVLSYIPL